MATETTVVHVTHEAVGKIGGIGAVLDGFFTSPAYLNAVERSILAGPLFTTEGPVHDRLGPHAEVLYSSVDGFLTPGYRSLFQRIETAYNVGIVYGRRTFTDERTGVSSSPEVLLVDVRHADRGPVNDFKRRLFEEFGIQSHLYEQSWEYEQYVRLAPATIAALWALDAAHPSTVVVSHEFMGMPTALGAMIEPGCAFKTVFYAHEVAPVRRIVEDHSGHDTLFYNVMKKAHAQGLYVNEVFGNQFGYFKHALVDAAKHCDHLFAVGDYVADELRFLAPEFENAAIRIVYNGIPAYPISLAEKLESKARLQAYCETLLGYRPDTVFTHVARLVKSKGLWRDLRILWALDKALREEHRRGVMYLLSTEVGQRRLSDINAMESHYGWPVAHREGWPDLSGGEATLYAHIQEFNAKSQAIKIVFVNQFGFDPTTCGRRMPADMEFMDIRKGTDVEFGTSIYEPFGIAQLEPLTFGGICVCSNVCGCAGFLRDVSRGQPVKNAIIADYTQMGDVPAHDVEDLLQINWAVRDRVEQAVSEQVAQEILLRLPQNDGQTQDLIRSGYALAKNMSWDVVVSDYLLKSLGQGPVATYAEVQARSIPA